jgi:hypothetical protein
LLGVEVVPVAGPSLSQELTGAEWTFEVRSGPAADGSMPEPIDPQPWREAITGLLAASSLVWDDTDKKGRPRRRECRQGLAGLELLEAGSAHARLRLWAGIDPQGRSLRPEQLRHWLEPLVGQPLRVGRQRRERLLLRAPSRQASPRASC